MIKTGIIAMIAGFTCLCIGFDAQHAGTIALIFYAYIRISQQIEELKNN